MLYELLLTAFKGQTVGKMVMGIKVVRSADGQVPAAPVGQAPVSLLRAVVDREHRRPPSGQGPADGHAGDPQADHESAPRRQSRAPGIPMKSA